MIIPGSFGRRRTPSVNNYVADAAYFDGTSDYLTRGADLTGAADSKVGTGSFWVKIPDIGTNIRYILHQSNGPHFSANFSGTGSSDGGGYLRWWGRNASSTEIMRINSVSHWNTAGFLNTWVHVIASWDLAAGTIQQYINDASDGTVVTNTNQDIDYTRNNFQVGSDQNGTNRYVGDIFDVWFDWSFMDLSVVSNRRKFISASGKPVDLGATGQLPLGADPALFLHLDDGETVANFAANAGSGGGMTVNGALSASSTSPTD